MRHLSKKEEAGIIIQNVKDQIDNIRDGFEAVLQNPLIGDQTKQAIQSFLLQQSNDDMFKISDLINEDIERILKENPEYSRSEFE